MIRRLKRTAKRLLAIRAVRSAYNGVTRALLALGGSSRLGATLYAAVGFATHNREQYAVLSGRRAYYRNLGRFRASHVELRRNIHRLEKGILMRPRRRTFARDYIEETLDFYRDALKRPADFPGTDVGEVRWAFGVLSEYFSIVSDDDAGIARARATFDALEAPDLDADLHPYPARELAETTITYDQILDLALSRRSVRWFLDKPVPRDLIDKALIVARQSPSACNRLPYEFLVFDEPEQARRVAAIPFGAAGYAHQIPTVIVVKGELSSYFSPRDRHVPYIDASLAAMAFMFALRTLGLSASVINWPDFEPQEAKISRVLGLKPHERIIMLMAVGYADPEGEVASSEKKSLDVLRRFNTLDVQRP